MFQYNRLHTGYNDQDSITVPLELKWRMRYQPDYPLDQLTVVGNRLYMASDKVNMLQEPDPVVRCVDAETGWLIWQRYWRAWYECDEMTAVAVGNGKAYFQIFNGYGSSFWACDAETGEVVWWDPFPVQIADYFAPTLYEDKVLGGGGDYGGMFCWDASTGQKQWYAGLGSYYEFAVAVHQDTMYSYVAGLIRAHDIDSGQLLWSVSTLLPDSTKSAWGTMHTAPVVDTVRHILYAMWHEHFHALDLTSREFLWHKYGKFDYYRRGINPTIYEDLVFAVDSGRLVAYNCLSGEEQWRLERDSSFTYHLAGANGLIFAGSDAKTSAIDIAGRRIVWECDVGGNVTIANNSLYISTIDGWIYVYGPPSVSVDDPLDPNDALPSNFILHQNYPNPFNPTTEISFTLPRVEHVRLDILNPLGQTVATLIDKRLSHGTHSVTWHATDGHGNPVATGPYFYRLTAGEHSEIRKMLLVK